MANQTIYPYGTDGQLPSDIGVINDLTTGGTDKALSAQQGVVIGYILGLINVTEGDEYIDVNIKYSAPVLTVSEDSLEMTAQKNSSATTTFTVEGVGLAGNLSIVASGTGLSVDKQTIAATESVVAETTVTVTFAPTATGTVNGTITISDGVTTKSISVTATATGQMVKYNDYSDETTYIEWELGQISTTTGENTGTSRCRTKDYLPCSGTVAVQRNWANVDLVFYNSEHAFVSSAWSATDGTINVPQGAAFFRVSVTNKDLQEVAKQYTTDGPWLTDNVRNGSHGMGGIYTTYA